MGARSGHRRRVQDGPAVTIGGRAFVIGRLYAEKVARTTCKPKRLLGYDPDDRRWPGGRVSYKTDSSVTPQTVAGAWWADAIGDAVDG